MDPLARAIIAAEEVLRAVFDADVKVAATISGETIKIEIKNARVETNRDEVCSFIEDVIAPIFLRIRPIDLWSDGGYEVFCGKNKEGYRASIIID